MHQGLTQMWSLAVEVAFYAALPLLAGLLLTVLCRGAVAAGSVAGRAGRTRRGDTTVAAAAHHHRRAAAVGDHLVARAPHLLRGRHGAGGAAGARHPLSCLARGAARGGGAAGGCPCRWPAMSR